MHAATAPSDLPSATSAARRRVPVPVALGLSVAAAGAAGGAALLASPWVLLAWLLPDLALVAGISPGFAQHGRLAPRAVPAYNALHALPGPLLLTAAGVAVPALLAAGLVWLSHVLADRALGYGLRARDGWQRG